MEAQALTWPRAGNDVPPPPERSLEEIEQEARDRGYADGLTAGEAAAQARAEEALERALAPVRSLHEALRSHQLTIQAEESEVLANLIVTAFKTLLAIQLRTDDKILAGVLMEAMEHLPHQDGLEIHAHPDLIEGLAAHFTDAQFVANEAMAPPALDVRAAGGRWRSDAVREFSRLVEDAFLRVEDAPSDR